MRRFESRSEVILSRREVRDSPNHISLPVVIQDNSSHGAVDQGDRLCNSQVTKEERRRLEELTILHLHLCIEGWLYLIRSVETSVFLDII